MTWQTTTGSEIAKFFGTELYGADNKLLRPAAIWEADEGSLCFLTGQPDVGMDKLNGTGLIIAARDLRPALKAAGHSVIEHEAPKFAFCKAVSVLMRPTTETGIHETAILGPEVTLGEDVTVGPYCVLQGRIELGDRVTLEAGVSLYNAVSVGSGSSIRSGARIGYDPFSFGESESGEAYPFPAYGGVKIGSFVEIYHNVSIARGNAADTVLEDWVRVGNHAHIGNSVKVDTGTTVCAQTDISAQVHIGPRCWIAQSAAIRQKLQIGAGTMVGMGAVVVSNVAEGVTVTGVPARVKDTVGR